MAAGWLPQIVELPASFLIVYGVLANVVSGIRTIWADLPLRFRQPDQEITARRLVPIGVLDQHDLPPARAAGVAEHVEVLAAGVPVPHGHGERRLEQRMHHLGPELRERLGVIRTRELLAARQIDHARQFFTRAVDFGFSKSADEALRLWDRDKILSDVVWVIRKFRPDVIATRFSPEDNLTHGHHTASAILGQEAFKAAADPKRFPEQLAWVKPWQATRLVWYTSPFFFQNRNQPFDPTGLTILEAGGFAPLLGKAFTEIAAASLSMHKSQGFGVDIERGARTERGDRRELPLRRGRARPRRGRGGTLPRAFRRYQRCADNR